MPTMSEDWSPIAQLMGYKSELEMLQDLYGVQHYSIEDLAQRLGYSKNNLRRRLLFNNIPLRARGGSNNLGRRYLADATDEELKDPRTAAATYKVHISTVYSEIKRRKECSSAQSCPSEISTPTAETEIPTLPSPSGLCDSPSTETGSSNAVEEETSSS